MARIELRLDSAGEGVRAGGEISGKAVLLDSAPWTVRWAQLVLCWKAENDRRSEVTEVCVVPLAAPGESLPPRTERPFRLAAPAYPRTFHGTHVRIFWYLLADVCAEGAKAEKQQFPVKILPALRAPELEREITLPEGAPPPWGGTV